MIATAQDERLAIVNMACALDDLVNACALVAAHATGLGAVSLAVVDARVKTAAQALASEFANMGEDMGNYEIRVVRLPRTDALARCARHELGHAVAGILLGLDVDGCMLDGKSPAGGATFNGPKIDFFVNRAPPRDEETRVSLEPLAFQVTAYLLAGPAAELLFDPDTGPTGSCSDLREASRLASEYGPPGEHAGWLRRAHRCAHALVRGARAAFPALTEELVRRGEIDATEIETSVKLAR
ncbi:MAG: hypothetical protein IPQ24_11305 [Anaeromyxobacter sp.]|nr:hypothetical protein [Anaeromyxobacter sp.]